MQSRCKSVGVETKLRAGRAGFRISVGAKISYFSKSRN